MWPIVVGASTIVGLLAGGLIALDNGEVELPQPPSGLAAAAETCVPPECERILSTVTLRWNEPTDPTVTGFRVMRDGAQTAEGLNHPTGSSEFTDHAVSAGQRHTYAVVAIGADGDSPPSNGVEALIPLPPLSAAQLRGIYDVALVVREATNLASLSGIPSPRPGEGRKTTWGFQPICEADQGACPTNWVGRSGVLRPRGTVWSGRVLGPEARCPDGERMPSPIHLRLSVRDAEMIGGVWTVIDFEGSYSVRFRCPGFVASNGTVEVTGRHT
jgi:hypothetical protein